VECSILQEKFVSSALDTTVDEGVEAVPSCYEYGDGQESTKRGSSHIQPKTSVKDFDLALISVGNQARCLASWQIGKH
jgi:hypothetical protein